jgi:two-component sensor histidine kinase
MAARTPLHPDASHGLAVAMVESSEAPLLLLDGDLIVVAASASFCRSFQIDSANVSDRSIFELGEGEWGVRKLRSLLDATRSGKADIKAYEMDLERRGRDPRRLLINARKLEFGDQTNARLLVTISDITDARIAERLKDDLLREKAMLLQEVQHRVANSLQIIASVLLQSARRVQSDETRTHLHDAHHRVMSIASVQKQLATSQLDDVELGSYFAQLCESLGASMISDPDQLSIEVTTDKSKVHADVSVSLGLIVTELVINALKHAFPDGRSGKILVDYQARGPNWTLSIADDGVGMPTEPVRATAGLGTSIVEALARQLRAHVQVANTKPGTNVSIIHAQIAVVDSKPTQAAV